MIFSSLEKALKKAKTNIFSRLNQFFTSKDAIDISFWDTLEECLIESDVSYQLVQDLLIELKTSSKENNINSYDSLKNELKRILIEELDKYKKDLSSNIPQIIMLLGINGVGKTTAAAKLAHYYHNRYGSNPLLCAADTFRAAANDQLSIWAERLNIDIVKHQEGADPSAVLYDSIKAASARKKDLVIVDTAGRLHTKKNLMAELEKMMRIAKRESNPETIEVLLVLDATVGQNGLSQAKAFSQHLPVNGIIITKLDGTAKGGIALSIVRELRIPISFVSTGESVDDFLPFSSSEYCNVLLDI